MKRSNGQAGTAGRAFALLGLGILLLGLFVGGQLPGQEVLGFVMVLVGALTVLFGVLREYADRQQR